VTLEEVTRQDFLSGATAAAVVPRGLRYEEDIEYLTSDNASKSQQKFEAFRKTIRPGMLWNPFVYRLTRELQRFGDALDAGKRPKLAISTPPQHGKLCSDSTIVCTTRGWCQHGDLRVNDFVFHPSGRPVRVVAVSDKAPARIRVELSNSEVIYCHERHEWTVVACRRKGKPMLTMETQELMRSVLSDGEIGKRGHHYQFHLPKVHPLQGSWQTLPLAPYVMGAWLGNGKRGAPQITQQLGDEGVIEGVEACGYVVSARNEWTQATGTKATHFSFWDYVQTNCSFVDGLAPIADRLELLAGLIDTDGSVTSSLKDGKVNGRVMFCTADKPLMLSFCRLIASFGWHPSVTKQPPRGFSGGELGPSGGQDCYYIGFSPTLKIPCRLPRKQMKRVFNDTKPVSIKSVTFDDRGEVGHCITVDSPDGLYLVGETMQPTHNSAAAEDFAAWLAGKRPDWKTIYASYSDDLGVRCNLNLQRLFVSERYRGVFPNFEIGHAHSRGLGSVWQMNSGLIEYVGYKGSFRNTTVRGQITGMELNLGIIDDFVKGRAEASSKNDRDKTWNWFTDDFMTRHSKDSALLVIATRWHISDLIGRMREKWKDMTVLNFPAIAEKDETFRKKGEALFPEHKPLDFLLERKQLMTESSWAAEYQGHPFLTGSGDIPIEKMKTLQYFDRSEVAATVLSVDKAGTEGGDGAQTAIVIMHRMKNGTYVIENIICGRWASLEREKYIKAWADYMRNQMSPLGAGFKVVIEIEPGSGGKESYEASVRNLAGHNVFGDKPGAGRSKEVRAEPFCAIVQGGQMWLHAGTWIPAFLEECGNWPMSPKKDQVDAAAQAFHWLTGATTGEYSLDVWKAAFG
jgi:hypothetical protein